MEEGMEIDEHKEIEAKHIIKRNLEDIGSNYIDQLNKKYNYFFFFSEGASKFKEMNLLKQHILLGKENPEIYLLPIKKCIAFAMHNLCTACCNWIKFFIGNKLNNKNKDIIVDKIFTDKNKIIILLYPKVTFLKYFDYDNLTEKDRYFIKNTNIDILYEGKGNVYARVQIKNIYNKNVNHVYDIMKKEIEKNIK